MPFEIAPWRRSRGMGPFWKRRDDFWDDLFQNMSVSGDRFDWSPSVDVTESNGSVLVKAELPGLEVEDIDVDVTDGLLILRGDKKTEEEKKDERVYCRERFHGTFQRAFRLPAGVKSDQVDARFKNGVLTITIPKSEESRQKKIEIKTA